MSEKNTPNVRFNGFNDPWEQRKLKRVTTRVKSYALTRAVETASFTGFKYIHYGDIHTKVANKIDNPNVLPNIKSGNYESLNANDIVVADASEDYKGIADAAILLNDAHFVIVAGLHTIALRPLNCNSMFIYYLLKTDIFKRYGYKVGTGLKVFGITYDNLVKFEFNAPSIKEQKMISQLLMKLEKQIASNQRKVDQLKEVKKLLMQKIFGQEWRFKGFTDPWEQRKLNQVVKIIAGGDIDKKKLRNQGTFPVIANSVTSNGIVGYYDNEYRINAPAVTVTGRGDVGHATARYTNFTPVIRLLAITSVLFNVKFLESAINEISLFSESTGVPQLTAPQLGNYKIKFASLNEQIKIGDLLTSIDSLIASNQEKVDQLTEMKKWCMQNMFV